MGHRMTKYASDLNDFSDLLAATAKAKNVPDAVIEKDYFVVRALRALCEAAPGQFVFKGGTSLAKGWNLLERFSEDIDLLLRTGGTQWADFSRRSGPTVRTGGADRGLHRRIAICATDAEPRCSSMFGF